MSHARRSPSLCAALLAALGLALGACSTQRWVGPMESTVDPLPPGARSSGPPGPLEVVVMRHADPVEIGPAGSLGSFPLRFYGKHERLKSGGVVYTKAGGKAEVLWPGRGASAVISGASVCRVGEPSRGEPDLLVLEVDRLQLVLGKDQSALLQGGVHLHGDPELENSGPFLVERRTREVLRVSNQSRGPCRVDFRGETLALGPGQAVELPILEPPPPAAAGEGEPREVAGLAFPLHVRGAVEAEPRGAGAWIRADGPGRATGFGLAIDFQGGEAVWIGAEPGEAGARLPVPATPPEAEPAASDPGVPPAEKGDVDPVPPAPPAPSPIPEVVPPAPTPETTPERGA